MIKETRPKVLQLRVTEKENSTIENNAKEMKLTISDYLRYIISQGLTNNKKEE